MHFPTRYPGQRSSSATPFSASLICRPHPAQVALLHIKHVSFQHIIYEKLIILILIGTIGEGQETKKVRQKKRPVSYTGRRPPPRDHCQLKER